MVALLLYTEKTMSRLYLANCTPQPHVFNYRAPNEEGKLVGQLRTKTINAGQQEIVADEKVEVLNQIIKHNEQYGGIVHMEDVDRVRGFKGLIYAIDREIPADYISGKFIENGEALNSRNEVMRKTETASLANSLAQRGLPISNIETSVQAIDENGKAGNKQTVQVSLPA